jgi:hypothetical protein
MPLTDEVTTSLLEYLRRGRILAYDDSPALPERAPAISRDVSKMLHASGRTQGERNNGSISKVVKAKRTGVFPFQGVHCLRHTYTLHLLRSGLSLKDNRRSAGGTERSNAPVSICDWRQNDLRDVPLDLPSGAYAANADGNTR